MELDAHHIKDVCYRVGMIGRTAGWRLNAMPVVQWEFATLHDYARARMDLLRAMTPEMHAMMRGNPEFRRISDHIEEVDIFGVTFRLICKQQIMTPRGPIGAADF